MSVGAHAHRQERHHPAQAQAQFQAHLHAQHQAQLREHDRRELRMAVNDPRARLERASRAELLVRHPRRIGNVDDEPAVASRHETRVDRLETRLLHHANRYAPGLMLSICAFCSLPL